MSICSAAGTLGNPGIVIIFPANATTKPAPAFKLISLIVILYFPLSCRFFASSDKRILCFLQYILVN